MDCSREAGELAAELAEREAELEGVRAQAAEREARAAAASREAAEAEHRLQAHRLPMPLLTSRASDRSYCKAL